MIQSQAALRQRHFARYQAILPAMTARLGWSREEIDAFAAQQLGAMLGHATANARFHAERLGRVDPGAPWAALNAAPPMNKLELMQHWDEIVTVPGASRAMAEAHVRDTVDEQYLFGDHVLMASGGTGGCPGLFLYDFDALAVNFAALSRTIMAALAARFGAGAPVRTAAIGAGVSAHGSYVMARIFSGDWPTLSLPLWQTPDQVFPALNAFDPAFVFATSSYAMQLVAGQAAGTLRINPHVFFFGSEHLTRAARDATRAAWPDAHVFTCWGTTEGAGTFPCPLGEGFHVCEDGIIIEPMNEAGQPCGPAEWSDHVLLTNLYNRALPLIRYRIDDVFEFDDAPCACGLAYRKVRQVHGRSTERFRYGALSIHAALVELSLLEQPMVAEYQIVQTPDGVEIRYSAARPADEARMMARVVRDLRQYGLAAPRVVIERVERVPRTSAGKVQRFVPLGAA